MDQLGRAPIERTYRKAIVSALTDSKRDGAIKFFIVTPIAITERNNQKELTQMQQYATLNYKQVPTCSQAIV